MNYFYHYLYMYVMYIIFRYIIIVARYASFDNVYISYLQTSRNRIKILNKNQKMNKAIKALI